MRHVLLGLGLIISLYAEQAVASEVNYNEVYKDALNAFRQYVDQQNKGHTKVTSITIEPITNATGKIGYVVVQFDNTSQSHRFVMPLEVQGAVLPPDQWHNVLRSKWSEAVLKYSVFLPDSHLSVGLQLEGLTKEVKAKIATLRTIGENLKSLKVAPGTYLNDLLKNQERLLRHALRAVTEMSIESKAQSGQSFSIEIPRENALTPKLLESRRDMILEALRAHEAKLEYYESKLRSGDLTPEGFTKFKELRELHRFQLSRFQFVLRALSSYVSLNEKLKRDSSSFFEIEKSLVEVQLRAVLALEKALKIAAEAHKNFTGAFNYNSDLFRKSLQNCLENWQVAEEVGLQFKGRFSSMAMGAELFKLQNFLSKALSTRGEHITRQNIIDAHNHFEALTDTIVKTLAQLSLEKEHYRRSTEVEHMQRVHVIDLELKALRTQLEMSERYHRQLRSVKAGKK